MTSKGEADVRQDMAQLEIMKRIMDNISEMNPKLRDIVVKFARFLEIINEFEIGKQSAKEIERLKELNQLKGSFRKLVEDNPIGMSISTREGKVIEANPAALRMFGVDSIEEFHEIATNSHWFDLKDKDRFNLELSKYGTVSGFEARLKRKGGSLFWVAITAARLGAGDFELANFFVDITQRKKEEIKG